MVTTTVHRPKHIGRIIKNRESELTHALLKTRLARRSVVLPVKMNVGHCPALGAFFFAQIGSAMSFFDNCKSFSWRAALLFRHGGPSGLHNRL